VSDREDKNEEKNIEQRGEEGETLEAAELEAAELARDAAAPAGEAAAPGPSPPSPSTPAPARRGFSAVAWLALLLALLLAGAGGWYVMQLQQREAGLVERLARVETLAQTRDNALNEFDDRWQRELRSGLADIEDDAGLPELRSGLAEIEDVTGQQARLINELDGRLADLRTELSRFSAVDRENWLLAEAEYLLRLANQRLIMAGDTASAQALIASTDRILRDLEDASLHAVRAALAADLAAVRAVPQVDVEGTYLRLSALIEQAGELVIFRLPEPEPGEMEVPAEDWQGRLQQGYQSALDKLSDYIVIRRRDEPMQTLMDPQWESLVRQNLRMLLEQAQVALLSGNQMLYRESLQRSNHWVAEFFASDEAAARSMAREIDQLADLQIDVPVPDLTRSLAALSDAIEQRLAQGGGE
jgi:uroporphyrin-3 C-methyltransferase